ncbi:unnamed protein product [Rotaria sordida]|uniref:Uncharacterized protein n=1 Tax=Rotaria sordida TaxID=392033 RepID=A0A815D8M4_9BILA|nr:unnamed protein product [Rotaria sordida]CAF1571658.1 unnamed protein product [Rotaria sordida]
MNEVIPIASLYADEHIPDELYVLVRNNLIDQLDARLYSLTNPTQYLTSVSWHGKEKLSLLMVAALNGYDEIVRILLAHCQSQQHVELEGRVAISEEDIIDGMTAIQCACYRSHFIVAKTLIEIGGADVHHDNKKWPCYPLLIQASAENRLEIVRFLVENGYSDINKTQSNDRHQCTALIWAAYKGYTALIEYLLEKGANVNYSCQNVDSHLSTPITFAVARDVNKRFNKLVHDSIFTNRLTMTRCFFYGGPFPQSNNPILDRFCSQILPSIHDKIK